MNIINSIISKPGWKTKIYKKIIYNKWKKEAIEQGENTTVVNFALTYLQHIATKSEKIYDDEDDYDWICDVKSDPNEVCFGNNKCECQCYFCGENGYSIQKPTLEEMIENMGLDEDDEDDKQQIETLNETLKLDCTCEIYKNLTISKMNYLNKFVNVVNKLVTKSQKSKLLKAINLLQNEQELTTGLDFQPGTNGTVVNIIHPALTCYVDGVSSIITPNIVTNIAKLQWLPLNYDVSSNKFTSFIQNVNVDKHDQLYKSLETIFTLFIPHFQEVLDNLCSNGKLDVHHNLLSYETLQVIPKIASTVLTPDNPTSSGTSWHLEGIKEENIICTGIYYVEMNNITQSKLKFRTTVTQHADIDYAQCCDANVFQHYGLNYGDKDDMNAVIELGDINTNQDMSIVFPNCFQHKVDSFSLLDPTKYGNRLILVFFLINPDHLSLSTHDVDNSAISLNDAKKYREILMFDRKFEIGDQENFFERGFTLCEH